MGFGRSNKTTQQVDMDAVYADIEKQATIQRWEQGQIAPHEQAAAEAGGYSAANVQANNQPAKTVSSYAEIKRNQQTVSQGAGMAGQYVEDYQKAMGRYQSAASAYNEKAEAYRTEYNGAVKSYNAKLEAYKTNAQIQSEAYQRSVDKYNSSADAYNNQYSSGKPYVIKVEENSRGLQNVYLSNGAAGEFGFSDKSMIPSVGDFAEYGNGVTDVRFAKPVSAPSQSSIQAPNYGTAPTANLPKEIDPFTMKAPRDISLLASGSSGAAATVDSKGESVSDRVKAANGVSGSAYTGSMDSETGILQKVMNKKL